MEMVRTKCNLLATKSSLLLLVILPVFAMTACAKKVTPVAPQPQEEVMAPDLEHTIQFQGETLGLIAAWYTGKVANWTAIEAANPGIKATNLKIGQVIVIPAGLIIKREQLPKKFIRQHGFKQSAPQSAVSEQAGSEGTASLEKQGEKTPPAAVSNASEKPSDAVVVNEVPTASATSAATMAATTADVDMAATGKSQGDNRDNSAGEKPSDEDSEREKLLEELLEQQ